MMVRVFQIMLFAVALGLMGAGYLAKQANSDHAAAQVQAILDADLAAQPVNDRVKMLENYVQNHMGASIDFELTGAYNRAQEAAAVYKEAMAKAQLANSAIYAQAQAACAGIKNAVQQTKCNQEYLNSHLQDVKIPDPVIDPVETDYQYKLVSPPWTADVVGALFLDAALTFVIAVLGLFFVKDPHR